MRERGRARSARPTATSWLIPACTDDLAVVGGADAVFLTLKAHSLPEMAPRLGPLLGPDTAVVTAQNGIPWWYFERHGGPLDGTRLRTVDPGGVIAAHLDARRVMGCVVYPATSLVEPGRRRARRGHPLLPGRAGRDGERALPAPSRPRSSRAGSRLPIRPRIRDEIWLKLLGNVASTR